MAKHLVTPLHLALLGLLAPGAALAEGATSGKAVYERLCASCHGADGRGNPEKAKALSIDPKLMDLRRPEARDLTREQRREILLKGKGSMPAYQRKLKPAEVEPVLDYATQLAGG